MILASEGSSFEARKAGCADERRGRQPSSREERIGCPDPTFGHQRFATAASAVACSYLPITLPSQKLISAVSRLVWNLHVMHQSDLSVRQSSRGPPVSPEPPPAAPRRGRSGP